MNSHSRHSLILLAILLALPAQAQTPKPAAPSAPPAAAREGAQSRVEAALEAVRQKVLAGDTDRKAYDELVTAINTSFDRLQSGTPDALAVRSRLVAALDDIYTRAKKAKIAPEEFAALRVEVLDASLLDVLAKWAAEPGEQALKAVEGSLKQLEDGVQQLEAGSGEWRGRVQTLLAGLKQKPAPEASDLAALQEELALARALRAESLLEKHATAKGAFATDFARAREHVSDLLELQSPRDPEARELRKKLLGLIDELEQRAAQATLTHADFESLRKDLAQRGGMMPAEKPKPHG